MSAGDNELSTSEKPALAVRTAFPRHLYFPLGCALITIVAFTLLFCRVPSIWPVFVEVLLPYGFVVIPVLLPMLVGHFVYKLARQLKQFKASTQQEKIDWYRSYLRQIPLLNIASATFALMITITSFTVHKGAAIGAGGYGFDALFIAWDRAIFGGADAWVFAHWLLPTPTLTKWIDFLYHPAFLPMLIGYLFCIASRGKLALCQTYMLSYLVSWVAIGMVAADALHSAGPLFDGALFGDGTTFGPLIERLQYQLSVGGGPQSSDLIRQYLLNLHMQDGINLGAGISAMPSMHIVLAALWVFPAWHLNKWLGVIATVYGLIIWIGSVHLGWHYFVDGLVGLVMVAIIWVTVGYILGLYGRAQVTRATT